MPPILLGAMLMAFSSLVGVMDAIIVRLVAAEVHPFEIVFFRSLFGLLALLAFLPAAERDLAAGKMWFVHVVRAVLKLLSLAAFFFAVTMLPLSLATVIAFTMPLFVSLGSIVFLKERPRVLRVAALFMGFIGVLIVLRPTQAPLGAGAILAVASAFGFATVTLLLKFSVGRESTLRIVWFNLLSTAPIAFLLCLPVWTTPSPMSLLLLALQGVGGVVSQIAFARAMKLADASLMVMVDFIRLPLSVALGFTLFGEALELAVLLGGAIILSSIVLLLKIEHSAAIRLPEP